MPSYAHSLENCPVDQWEPLFTPLGSSEALCPGNSCLRCQRLEPNHGHLNKVAWLASRFAANMFPEGPSSECASEWGRIAGLWHDLGKFPEEWQDYLKAKTDPHADEISGKMDHATAGAQHAVKQDRIWGQLLAFIIAGHHSGLLNATSNNACQQARLAKENLPDWSSAPSDILDLPLPKLPPRIQDNLSRSRKDAAFSLQFFTRMLFSCLVDADFLATEAFMNRSKANSRNNAPDNVLRQIADLVSRHIASFGEPEPGDTVNSQRRVVVDDCRAAAESSPGLFTLTVPTGGGKTLSSLLFALLHAIKHGQQRVIFVVPFTSIIEQNAEVIRSIVAPLASSDFTPLIEHHSALDPNRETEQSRLASENWDAPLIITTAVQFYESLFAAKTSACRKLHNIANAVVILDEAQSLPVDFLSPCLRTIEELSTVYNSSLVLCTATQPAIHHDSDEFPIGLKNCREIIQDTPSLFSALKRVETTFLGKLADSDLVNRLLEHDQVLCIVNRRKHAHDLFRLLGNSGENFHLSALMCPQHRSDILAKIRERLRDGLPVRLVSTQLIEAGVDIDFPVVFRSLAGLDSIAQAAGRCNRNGKIPLGTTYIFLAEDTDAEGYFHQTADVASQIIALDRYPDLLGEDAIHHYFDLYYYRNQSRWDKKMLLDSSMFSLSGPNFLFQFSDAAKKFKLIDEKQVPVIVRYSNSEKTSREQPEIDQLIADLRNPAIPLNRNLLRKLQRYTVQISPKLRDNNINSFEVLRDGQYHVLISPELNYSPDFGVTFAREDLIYHQTII